MIKKNIFQGISPEILKKRRKIKQPTFIKPMLATLTTKYFSDEHWMYEHKFDGERCLAIKKNGVVHLKSRNNRITNTEYPELVAALTKQKADNFIIDGEIIACNKKGISDFQLLQGRMHLQGEQEIAEKKHAVPIKYCIFDLVYVDGYDITHLPLYARKKALKRLLSFNVTLEYTQELSGNGIILFKKACRLKWEGLIVKRREGIYSVGVRSPNWLKFKCSVGQELVIGGFTEPKGTRGYFGALLVGYFDNNKFMYAGKVGTGFTHEILSMLGKKLKKITTTKCPFVNYDVSTKGVTWVRPDIVAEFEFAQWTKGGKLRVGRYKGLRDDKSAHKVVREAKS